MPSVCNFIPEIWCYRLGYAQVRLNLPAKIVQNGMKQPHNNRTHASEKCDV
jgi:hypothetical protein